MVVDFAVGENFRDVTEFATKPDKIWNITYLKGLQPDTPTTPLPMRYASMGYTSIGFPSMGYTSIKLLNFLVLIVLL